MEKNKPGSEELARGDRRTFRIFMFLAAVLIPLFGFMYQLTDPTADDPMWPRYVLGFLFLFATIASIYLPFFKRHTATIFYILSFLMFIWLPWLLWKTSLLLNYVLGYTMAFSAIMVAFKNNRILVAFILYVFLVTCLIGFSLESPQTAPLIFSGSIGTLGLAAYFGVGIRNNMQSSVLSKEERFRSLVEHAQDVIALIGADGTMFYISPAIEHISGFSVKEVLRMSLQERLHPEERSRIMKLFADLKTTPGRIVPALLRLQRKGGDYYWAEGTFFNMLDVESVQAIVFNYRDVTEKIKAEEALRISNQRYELVSKATSDAIWDWNLLTNQLYWNEGYNKLFGYPINETVTIEAWVSRIHPEDLERVKEKLNSVINEGSSNYWEDEYRYLRSNGEIAYVVDRGYIIQNDEGKPVRMTGAMQDITDKKLAENERNKITSDLIQRNTDLEQFAYIVSHNLRGPVANIIGITEMLRNHDLDEEDHEEFIKGLNDSVQKLDSVIKDLNQVLGVRKEFSEKKERVELQKLVNDILSSIRIMIEKQNAIVQTDFEVPTIHSLKSYLHSVFHNLIVNSIKYRRPDVSPHIKITSRKDDDMIILEFSDNGTGIDLQRNGDQVFTLYKRFHKNVEGKGMGLYMVKTQIEAMGGSITVDSQPGEGTTFTVQLPG